MLLRFGVHTTAVITVPGLGTKRSGTLGLRFQILGNDKNIVRFFESVGFEYHREQQKIASLASAYLRYKLEVVAVREKTRFAVRQAYAQGISVAALRKQYSDTHTPGQFIEHSAWSERRNVPRTALNFLLFKNFASQYSYGEDGFYLDEVTAITLEPYDGWVYDFTVNHPDHNFLADGLVVSNCGVRLLSTELPKSDILPRLRDIGEAIFSEVPSGVGRGGRLLLKNKDLDAVLAGGARYMRTLGFVQERDLEYTESGGALEGADPAHVSQHAKERGRKQLGTMGAGNHFVEVGYVERIFDEEAASRAGLRENGVTALIHTGSRGLGHQVATDYIRIMNRAISRYDIRLPDRELACAPISSNKGRHYLAAMQAAANFAWANRQLITAEVRTAFKKVFGEGATLSVVYDVAHNIAKIEEHEINGDKRKLIVHRKGATRAFPEQPVIIPGSMGTASYVLTGQEASLTQSFGSSCHGAGRRMSRTQARKRFNTETLRDDLEAQGIVVTAGSARGLIEEAPLAYKDIDDVVGVIHEAGIAKKLARLRPLAVVKG
jgi:tRNA-splicing ligase RtcB